MSCKRKINNELNKFGFTIIHDIADVSQTNISLKKYDLEHTLHNNLNGENDFKRKQIHFNENKPKFLYDYEKNLLQLFPKYTKPQSSILKSYSGCKEQNAHVDYHIKEMFVRKLKRAKYPPLNAILGIDTGAKIKVWKKSHVLLFSSCGVKRRSARLIKRIVPEYISIPVGSALVFRGDCVHAGCAYDTENIRIHTFLTPIKETYSDCLPDRKNDVITKNMTFVKDVIVE